MKKLKIIIATLCVAVIGVGIFVSCEKESVNDNSIASNSNKIQKDGEGEYLVDDYTLVKGETEANYHWYNPEILDPVPEVCDIVKEPGHALGQFFYEDNKMTIICREPGSSCGVAKEYDDNNNLVRQGIWAIEPETNIEYVILYPVAAE